MLLGQKKECGGNAIRERIPARRLPVRRTATPKIRGPAAPANFPEIAKKLKRTLAAVQAKARTLGLRKAVRKVAKKKPARKPARRKVARKTVARKKTKKAPARKKVARKATKNKVTRKKATRRKR